MQPRRSGTFWGLWLGFCLLASGEWQTCQAQWASEFQLGTIQVHSEVPAEKIIGTLQQLPALKERIEQTLQIKIEATAIDVQIFASQRSYRNYIRPRVPEAVNRPALFVKGPDTLWVYVTYQSGWETDLRHEMTHAYLHSTLPYLPIWRDEGLAKYFELPAERAGLNADFAKSVAWRIRLRQGLRSTDLEGLKELTDMRGDHYRDCWAWVYYCLHSSPQTRLALQSYLQTIQRQEVAGRFFQHLEKQVPTAVTDAPAFFRNL